MHGPADVVESSPMAYVVGMCLMAYRNYGHTTYFHDADTTITILVFHHNVILLAGKSHIS